MLKRTRFLPTYSSLNFIIFLSLQFSDIKKSSFVSQGLRGTQSWNLVHTWTEGWCIIYTWIGLLVFIYSFISSIFLLSNSKTLNFLLLFCEAYKVETWYTHGQRVDLLSTPNASSQNILVPLFFFLFLSLQLTKIKNWRLQNCFNLPLMATAEGMRALLTLCYIFLGKNTLSVPSIKTKLYAHAFIYKWGVFISYGFNPICLWRFAVILIMWY